MELIFDIVPVGFLIKTLFRLGYFSKRIFFFARKGKTLKRKFEGKILEKADLNFIKTRKKNFISFIKCNKVK